MHHDTDVTATCAHTTLRRLDGVGAGISRPGRTDTLPLRDSRWSGRVRPRGRRFGRGAGGRRCCGPCWARCGAGAREGRPCAPVRPRPFGASRPAVCPEGLPSLAHGPPIGLGLRQPLGPPKPMADVLPVWGSLRRVRVHRVDPLPCNAAGLARRGVVLLSGDDDLSPHAWIVGNAEKKLRLVTRGQVAASKSSGKSPRNSWGPVPIITLHPLLPRFHP